VKQRDSITVVIYVNLSLQLHVLTNTFHVVNKEQTVRE